MDVNSAYVAFFTILLLLLGVFAMNLFLTVAGIENSGPCGPSGTPGAQGASGKASTVPGPSGAQGPPNGPSGPTGGSGASGGSGLQGESGVSGVSGISGVSGVSGVSGIAATTFLNYNPPDSLVLDATDPLMTIYSMSTSSTTKLSNQASNASFAFVGSQWNISPTTITLTKVTIGYQVQFISPPPSTIAFSFDLYTAAATFTTFTLKQNIATVTKSGSQTKFTNTLSINLSPAVVILPTGPWTIGFTDFGAGSTVNTLAVAFTYTG